MPDKRPSVKNEEQYEALKNKGMSKEPGRAAKLHPCKSGGEAGRRPVKGHQSESSSGRSSSIRS